ncbi:hypothetical protein GCM10009609_37310 [Pseudonocardia aurantiaca]
MGEVLRVLEMMLAGVVVAAHMVVFWAAYEFVREVVLENGRPPPVSEVHVIRAVPPTSYWRSMPTADGGVAPVTRGGSGGSFAGGAGSNHIEP